MEVVPTPELQVELQPFERRRLELLATARGKYALIRSSELAGTFDSETKRWGLATAVFGMNRFW